MRYTRKGMHWVYATQTHHCQLRNLTSHFKAPPTVLNYYFLLINPILQLSSPYQCNDRHKNIDHWHHQHQQKVMEASREWRSWQYKFMDRSRLSARATTANCFIFGAFIFLIVVIMLVLFFPMLLLEVRVRVFFFSRESEFFLAGTQSLFSREAEWHLSDKTGATSALYCRQTVWDAGHSGFFYANLDVVH